MTSDTSFKQSSASTCHYFAITFICITLSLSAQQSEYLSLFGIHYGHFLLGFGAVGDSEFGSLFKKVFCVTWELCLLFDIVKFMYASLHISVVDNYVSEGPLENMDSYVVRPRV